MTTISEGALTFSFPLGALVCKYDDTCFYRNQFIKMSDHIKAMDIAYIDGKTLWLIEVKDYREHRRTKSLDLVDEIAGKLRDTLAGLVAARNNANEKKNREFARRALSTKQICVVLHLEENPSSSKLFPAKSSKVALEQKMKQKLKSVSPHPKIVSMNSLRPNMDWQVTG